MKQKLLLSLAALTLIVGASWYATHQVSAQEATNPKDSLVQKLADRFNLNPAEVETVFTEHHQEMRQNRAAAFEARLSQAVTNGKLTEEQKQAILTKHQEIQIQMETLKDVDPAARHEAMQKLHQEMKSWAATQNLSLPEIMGHSMRDFKFGSGHGMMFEAKLD